METCFDLADYKVEQEVLAQMMVRSVPEIDSEKVRAIKVDIWKKEEKGAFWELFSPGNCISSWKYEKHDPYKTVNLQ